MHQHALYTKITRYRVNSAMDTVKSFKGYGKVDEREDSEFRRKTRKRLIILSISAVLLIALITGIVAGTIAHKKNKSSDETPATSAVLKSICSMTEHSESCVTSLSSSNSFEFPDRVYKQEQQPERDDEAGAPRLQRRVRRRNGVAERHHQRRERQRRKAASFRR